MSKTLGKKQAKGAGKSTRLLSLIQAWALELIHDMGAMKALRNGSIFGKRTVLYSPECTHAVCLRMKKEKPLVLNALIFSWHLLAPDS